MAKNNKNPKVKLGNVSIPPFERSDVKVRISIFVDADILDGFKDAAKKHGTGYQTLMNLKLRESLPGLDKTLADRVTELERLIKKTG